MKSIRTHAAAAALLLFPMASVLVAQPAAAQHAVVAQPAVRSIALDSSAGLAPGAVLRVQVFATPGARNANVVLGKSGVRVALREQAAGRYVGTYRVRRGDRIDPLQRLTARVSYRGGTVVAQSFNFPPAFQALAMGNAARRDRQAPRVIGLTPSNGDRVEERGRTFIHARLADKGSGVDPRSVRLLVDGLNVTGDARITDDEIAYRERLGRGQHRAELVVRDHAGNVNRTAWTFRVV
ncbi:MAG TPA: hypothetical protein VGD76_05495 [Ramlibacter sp.]